MLCFYRYSGEVFGISNMFATVPGIIAPPLVNALTPTVSVLGDYCPITQLGNIEIEILCVITSVLSNTVLYMRDCGL